MPWSYEIDDSARIVRFRLNGQVSDADVLDADQALRDDPAFVPDYDQLIDALGAQEAAITTACLRELASRPPHFSETSRRAIVVRSDLAYGLARIFQSRRGDVAGEIRLFRSLEDAGEWLKKGVSGE